MILIFRRERHLSKHGGAAEPGRFDNPTALVYHFFLLSFDGPPRAHATPTMPQDSSQADFWDTRYRTGVTPWDAGGVPAEVIEFSQSLPHGARVLVPGCGTGYEVGWLAEHGFEVEGIDFSEAAVAAARQALGHWHGRVRQADFFALSPQAGYDWIYERAFLCALPRSLWPAYAQEMARLIAPGGLLAGAFFLGDTLKGPPFGTTLTELRDLLGEHFDLMDDKPTVQPLPVFKGQEHWLIWRRQGQTT